MSENKVDEKPEQRFYLLDENKEIYQVTGKDITEIFDQMEEWMTNHRERKLVEHTQIDAEVRLHTDFMGIDSSDGKGDPVCFESEWQGGPFDQQKIGYKTFEEAQKGHRQQLIEYLKYQQQ